MVPSSARTPEDARGNSHEYRLGLLPSPVRFPVCLRRQRRHGARTGGPWANGRRRGVPSYVSAAPSAPGGVSARLGANGRGVVARRLRVTQPACAGRRAGQAGRNRPAYVLSVRSGRHAARRHGDQT